MARSFRFFQFRLNAERMNFYTELKHRPHDVIHYLRCFEMTEEFFNSLRIADREPAFSTYNRSWRAARYLFIQRCSVNASMPVNKNGQFICAYNQAAEPAEVFCEDNISITNASPLG